MTLRDDAGRFFVDLFFQRVDGAVAITYGAGLFGIAGFKRLGGARDGLFDQAAHAHYLRLDAFEVAVEA